MNVLLCLWLACGALFADEPQTTTSPATAGATATAEAAPAPTETPTNTPATPPGDAAGSVSNSGATTGAAIDTPADAGVKDTAPVATPSNKTDTSAPISGDVVPGTSVKITTTEVDDGSTLGALLTLFKVIAILVLPFVFAKLLCEWLRVRDLSFRLGLVLFTLTLGMAPFVSVMLEGRPPMEALRFGIDLAGGTNMVFAADKEAAKAAGKPIDNAAMEKTIAAVGKRINSAGTEEITVRKVGSDRIEVIVPKATAEKVESVKRRIVDLGSLEFDIMANIYEHQDIIALAEPTRTRPEVIDIKSGDRLVAKWRPVALNPTTGKPKPVDGDPASAAPRTVERNGKQVQEFLLVVEPDTKRRITGEYLRRADETMSESGPVVGFHFNQEGGYLFRQLTNRYQPREGSHHNRLAILLNEQIHSAPRINAVIGADGIIEGQFDQQELDELIGVLNAGALDVPLIRTPVAEYTVSPLLGIDVQTKGYRAMVLSLLSVYVVMLVYYWRLGLIASLCMTANLVLLMGTMSLINATFTLPGLAGVVLTIGMSVDANVLIYERFREERDKGSSLRMTIHNGFHKALGTIIDSHLTTLITSVVLYVVGTEQIRGFAVSLFIGIVISLFTALYMGRLLFDLAERMRWLKSIKMMEAIGETHYTFSKNNKMFALISCTLIAIGLGIFAWRGKNNLDIDFRGGTMATFTFVNEQPPTIDEMQKRLDEKFNEAIALEELTTSDKPPRKLVRIRTIKTNPAEVSQLVSEAFADAPQQLNRQIVTVGSVAQIPFEPQTSFSGGQKLELGLKFGVAPIAIRDALADSLAQLKDESGQTKYNDPRSMLNVTAIEKTGEKSDDVLIEAIPEVAAADLTAAVQQYKTVIEARPQFDELSNFDQAVAGQTQWIAITAVVMSMLVTIAYLWFRFQSVEFGLAAIIAVMHDLLAVMGLVTIIGLFSNNPIAKALGLSDFKLNLSMVASYLTIVGYSLNDTIVVFDRIREIRGKGVTVSRQLVDQALNQTLSRTLLTGVTTLIVIFIMYSIGGEGLRGFAFTLFMGIVIGTYSSIYIASPALVWLMNRKRQSAVRGAVNPRYQGGSGGMVTSPR